MHGHSQQHGDSRYLETPSPRALLIGASTLDDRDSVRALISQIAAFKNLRGEDQFKLGVVYKSGAQVNTQKKMLAELGIGEDRIEFKSEKEAYHWVTEQSRRMPVAVMTGSDISDLVGLRRDIADFQKEQLSRGIGHLVFMISQEDNIGKDIDGPRFAFEAMFYKVLDKFHNHDEIKDQIETLIQQGAPASEILTILFEALPPMDSQQFIEMVVEFKRVADLLTTQA
jgi:hypothetical protein